MIFSYFKGGHCFLFFVTTLVFFSFFVIIKCFIRVLMYGIFGLFHCGKVE